MLKMERPTGVTTSTASSPLPAPRPAPPFKDTPTIPTPQPPREEQPGPQVETAGIVPKSVQEPEISQILKSFLANILTVASEFC